MRPRSPVVAGTLPLVLLASSAVVLIGSALKASFSSGLDEPQKAKIEETLGRLPLSFIENR